MLCGCDIYTLDAPGIMLLMNVGCRNCCKQQQQKVLIKIILKKGLIKNNTKKGFNENNTKIKRKQIKLLTIDNLRYLLNNKYNVC